MRKRTKALVFAVCLAAAAALIAFLAHDREPRYQHHRLSYWTSLYLHKSQPVMASPAQQELANQAIRHIGTNAIPHLLTWFQYYGHPRAQWLDALYRHLPEPIRRSQFVMRHLDRNDRRAYAAALALAALGPQVKPAVPELIRLMTSTNSSDDWLHEAAMLKLIGGPAIPALASAATDTNTPNRYRVVFCLGLLTTNSSLTTPLLTHLLQEPDPSLLLKDQDTLNRIASEVLTNTPAQ